MEERRRRLAGGEIVGAGSSFTPQNTISRAIKKGARQLEFFSQSQDQIRLLWLLAKGSDAEAQREQFRSTLYGLANVVGPDDSSLIPCYYLRHSAYFRWRTVVDGAVISTEDEHQLCLNTYSDRWEVLCDSDLGRIFGTAVVNPILLDRAAEAYIADCELDRNDEPAVLRYLQDKYGRPALMTMNLGSLVAYVESHLKEGANGSDT